MSLVASYSRLNRAAVKALVSEWAARAIIMNPWGETRV
jgi:hypothetical protein